MDIPNTLPDENLIIQKAHIINISPEVHTQVILPTITNLHLDLEQWTAPLKNSGIAVKPINYNPEKKDAKKSNKPLKTKKNKNPSELDKKETLDKAKFLAQTVELAPGFKPIYGATKHVKLRIGASEHTLLLSAAGTPQGSWSIIDSFDAVSGKPEISPFNEQTYTGLLYKHFEC